MMGGGSAWFSVSVMGHLRFFLVEKEAEEKSACSGVLLQDSPGVLVPDERKTTKQKTASPSKQALGDVQNAAHTSVLLVISECV